MNSTDSSEDVESLIIESQRRLCDQNDPMSSSPPPTAGVVVNTTPSPEAGLFCPRTFDGWSCWPETPAGSTVYQQCPHFITGFDPNRQGHKVCLEDGTWFRHPITNVTWSNYTTCVDMNELAWRQNVVIIQITGYVVSLCFLIASLCIFCSFRSLQCTRVRIHKHLFASFIINNTLWLIWYSVITIPHVLVNPANKVWCASLHILVQYFLVANYFWMFCEGFYLHTLIVFTFLARYESKLLMGFYLLGWFGPALPVTLYAVFRGLLDRNSAGATRECWVHISVWTLFLSVPVCCSLVLSLVFMVNILRVLVTKLRNDRRQSWSQTDSGNANATAAATVARGPRRHRGHVGDRDDSQNAVRKAARATLILVPLLGLHYLLTPFRPAGGTEEEVIYEYVTAVSLSFQGLCVSMLFCFCNGEVISAVRRRFFPRLTAATGARRPRFTGSMAGAVCWQWLTKRARAHAHIGTSTIGDTGATTNSANTTTTINLSPCDLVGSEEISKKVGPG